MAQRHSTSMTRRSAVAGLAFAAAPIIVPRADKAYAQAKQPSPDKSLYERLGGVFAIAAVVDHFSDGAVVKNPVVGQKSKNPHLREWQASPATALRLVIDVECRCAIGQLHGGQVRLAWDVGICGSLMPSPRRAPLSQACSLGCSSRKKVPACLLMSGQRGPSSSPGSASTARDRELLT